MYALLAKKYAVNESEVALRWAIDSGFVTITTSSKEKRLSDFMRVLAFKLTPREKDDISEAGLQKHYRGFWTEKFAEDDRS